MTVTLLSGKDFTEDLSETRGGTIKKVCVGFGHLDRDLTPLCPVYFCPRVKLGNHYLNCGIDHTRFGRIGVLHLKYATVSRQFLNNSQITHSGPPRS